MTTAASPRPSGRDGTWPAMIDFTQRKPAVVARQVVDSHRVAIDQRLVERRRIEVGDDVFRQHAAQRLLDQRHDAGRQRPRLLQHGVKRLVDGQHGDRLARPTSASDAVTLIQEVLEELGPLDRSGSSRDETGRLPAESACAARP